LIDTSQQGRDYGLFSRVFRAGGGEAGRDDGGVELLKRGHTASPFPPTRGLVSAVSSPLGRFWGKIDML